MNHIGKKALAAILAGSLAISAPGCAMFQGSAKDPSAAQQAAHVAFGFAKTGLTYLQEEVTRYIDSMEDPSDEQIAEAAEMVQRLDRAKIALALAEPYVLGEKQGDADLKTYILDSAQSLKIIAEELKSHGIRVPSVILVGLDLAISYAKSE